MEQKIQIADKPTLDKIGESVAFKNNLVSEIMGSISNAGEGSQCPIVVYKGEIHVFCYDSDQNSVHYKWNGSSFEKVSDAPYDSTTGGVAVVYNDEIHLIGGIGGATKHYKWDGTAWSSVSTIPGIGSGGVAIVYKDELYVLHVPTDEGSGIVYCNYKWNGSSWQKVGETPFEQITYILKAVVFNGEVHAFGWGGADSLYTIHLKSSDLVTWTTASTAPISTQACGVVVHEGAIHMFGGNGKLTTSSGYTDGKHTYHYMWDGISWTELEELEDDFHNGSAVSLGDYLYLFTYGALLRRIGKENNIDKLFRRIRELEEKIPTSNSIKSLIKAYSYPNIKECGKHVTSDDITIEKTGIKKIRITIQGAGLAVLKVNSLTIDGKVMSDFSSLYLYQLPFVVTHAFGSGDAYKVCVIEIDCSWSVKLAMYNQNGNDSATITYATFA